MKLFGKSTSNKGYQESTTVLFVCVENAGRSQIAEGFFKKYTSNGFKSSKCRN